MSGTRPGQDQELARLQELLEALAAIPDPAARAAAKGLVQAVIALHGAALTDLLAIVRESGGPLSESLLAKFAANPRICGLLLLHDLHPEDLTTRVSRAVERLRPHLGVLGVRADLAGVDQDAVRIDVAATGQKSQRPAAADLRAQIETAVLEAAPDATRILIQGLDDTAQASEVYVPLSAVSKHTREDPRRHDGEKTAAAG